ncbi:MAG: hypothetical protein ACYSYW_14245 [Planctomycetota bacterium]
MRQSLGRVSITGTVMLGMWIYGTTECPDRKGSGGKMNLDISSKCIVGGINRDQCSLSEWNAYVVTRKCMSAARLDGMMVAIHPDKRSAPIMKGLNLYE